MVGVLIGIAHRKARATYAIIYYFFNDSLTVIARIPDKRSNAGNQAVLAWAKRVVEFKFNNTQHAQTVRRKENPLRSRVKVENLTATAIRDSKR